MVFMASFIDKCIPGGVFSAAFLLSYNNRLLLNSCFRPPDSIILGSVREKKASSATRTAELSMFSVLMATALW